MPDSVIREAIQALGLEVVGFELEQAYQCALLRPLTKSAGLSLGDRACLALAQQRGQPVITADRAWATLALGVTMTVIR